MELEVMTSGPMLSSHSEPVLCNTKARLPVLLSSLPLPAPQLRQEGLPEFWEMALFTWKKN